MNNKAKKSTEKPEIKSEDKVSKSDIKNTSLRLEKKTLKALKIRAIEEDTSIQKLIERLVIEYLAKDVEDSKH